MNRKIPTYRPFPRALTVIGIAVVAVLAAVLLTGCTKKQEVERANIVYVVDDMRVTTDALTGCQYLSMSYRSMTPRMDRNGKQICK